MLRRAVTLDAAHLEARYGLSRALLRLGRTRGGAAGASRLRAAPAEGDGRRASSIPGQPAEDRRGAEGRWGAGTVRCLAAALSASVVAIECTSAQRSVTFDERRRGRRADLHPHQRCERREVPRRDDGVGRVAVSTTTTTAGSISSSSTAVRSRRGGERRARATGSFATWGRARSRT